MKTNKYRIIKEKYLASDSPIRYFAILQKRVFFVWTHVRLIIWNENACENLKDWLVTELKSNNTEIIEEFYL